MQKEKNKTGLYKFVIIGSRDLITLILVIGH